jgi:hypothetical protein
MDTMLAYYMFVNHGRFPSEIVDLPEDEKILMYQMAVKEINSRPKK